MAPRLLLPSVALFAVITAACDRSPPTPPGPAAAPTPPPAPTPSAPLAPPPPPAPEAPPPEDPTRFVAFDRENLRRHVAFLAFARKARAQLEKARANPKGGAKAVLALQASQQKPIAAQTQALNAMDPQGDRSYLTTDHQTNLQYLADEYPAAIIGAFSGDPGPLDELRVEMDRVEKKIEDWLRRVRQADTSAGGK